MTRSILVLAALAFLCAGAAGCKKKEAPPGGGKAAATGSPTTRPSDVKAQTPTSPELKPGDVTRCPVSGETFTIDAKSPFTIYQGKKIYLCCDKCKAPFEKAPAKYLKG